MIWMSNHKAWMTAPLFEDWLDHHVAPEVGGYYQFKEIPFKVMLMIDTHPRTTLINFDPHVKVDFLLPY